MDTSALDEATLLAVWDSAASLARPWKELSLLRAASDVPLDELARLPIGERDRRLLALHEATFGPCVDCETSCPSCGQRLEFTVDLTAVQLPPTSVAPSEMRLREQQVDVTFRLADSSDIAVAGEADGCAVNVLLDRCVTATMPDGTPIAGHQLPDSLRSLISGRMAMLDPQADLLAECRCPACELVWQAEFDPAEFLLRTVDTYAGHLMHDVHRLASAYGWHEDEILALGPVRRGVYLELAAP